MGRAWLIIAGKDASASAARYDLKPGLTMLGGTKGDVPVPGSGNDCVHLWSEPPKLIFVGAGDPPQVNGHAAFEMALHSGDRLEWRGLVATFDTEAGQPRMEEIPSDWLSPAHAEHALEIVSEIGAPSTSAPNWRWLKAGMVAEMSLGDPAVINRWQESAARGEFDADAAARDLLAAAPGLSDSDPRVRERSARLMRELMMSSAAKRPIRQVQAAEGRSGIAIALMQLMIVVLCFLIVLAALLVARSRFHQSIDGVLDRILESIYSIL